MRSDELRHAARYQWRHILPALGIPPEKLTNKHQPCPVCKGRDHYRFDDRDSLGSYICTHCGNGDGFSLVMHWLDCDYKTAAALFQTFWASGKGRHQPHGENRPRRRLRAHATKSTASCASGTPPCRWKRATP